MRDPHARALIEVEDLSVHFPLKGSILPWKPKPVVKAVNNVHFRLNAGETLGIVGESGCGKSSLARAVLCLIKSTSGRVLWLGDNILEYPKSRLREMRRNMQIVFQDPYASLDPRMTIGKIVAEPLITHSPHLSKEEVRQRVKQILAKVGLLPNLINRYPHEFSGGQCQRIGIARALILEPELLVCDEPVSALDVSIQAQVINLLKRIQNEMGLAMMFIAHDLSIIKHISNRVMVMYLGNVVESGPCRVVYSNPRHPYTQALLSAIPLPDPDVERNKQIQLLEGDLPSPINPPNGCVFHTRCPVKIEKCLSVKPEVKSTGDHYTACHLV